jgi:predicted HTH transcriptional regulator
MEIIWVWLIAVGVVGFGFGVWVALWLRTHKEATTLRDELSGIYAVAIERTIRKNSNKTAIMQLLKSRGEMTNSEIRDEIGVSRQSVVNYMDELEKEGKIVQIGTTGRGVTYKIKD